jgi:hypothetical protein
VPQIIQPMAFDQFDNASRVTQLGVGNEILPRHFAPERVARSLETLVTDASIVASCKRYKDLLQDADGIMQTCNRLLEALNNKVLCIRIAQHCSEADTGRSGMSTAGSGQGGCAPAATAPNQTPATSSAID